VVDTTEDEVAALVDRVRATPARRDALVGLLAEDAPVHAGRGTGSTARVRAWVLVTFADVGLPDEALPVVYEELESGREPVLVAAAARALRGRLAVDATAARFLLRALWRMAELDEPVSFDALRPTWPARAPTSALLEVLHTLAAAGPQVHDELLRFRAGYAGPLGQEVRDRLDAAVAATGAAPCCGASGAVPAAPATSRPGHDGRDPATGPLPDGVELEDQDGQRLRLTDLVGQPTVLAWFYTRCTNSSKCSLTVTKLADLRRRAGTDVQIVAVTYDPAFDLPARLRRYGTDRGLRFGPTTRMVRAVAGHELLRAHFALRVGYVGSVVNRHGIELFLLDHDGAVRRTWSRVQWDPDEVLADARALAAATPG
jgi:protein SCO1